MTWKETLFPVLRVAAYAGLLLGLGYVLIYVHSESDPWAVFGEDGRVEVAQVVLIGIAFLLCLITASRHPQSRPLSVLLAGVLAAMLVREHNNYFKDHVGDGVWQMLAGIVLGATLGIAWRWRRNLLPSLEAFVVGPGLGWLGAGVLAILFGQLTDEVALWDFLLGEGGYPYAARRIMEECFELVGLFFCLVGLFEHHLALTRKGAGPGASQASSA